MKSKNKHFLICRTDNIGDVLLTLPIAYLLKQHYPECKVSFLAKSISIEAIHNCSDVDQFINYSKFDHFSKKDTISYLASLNIDVALCVFPNRYLVSSLAKAGIPTRIGTSRRWFHWLYCNQKVSFSRSKSVLHESELNIQLLQPLGIKYNAGFKGLASMIRIPKRDDVDENYLSSIIQSKKFNLVLHPFSNKSAREWPVESFINLVNCLSSYPINFIFTGSKQESSKIRTICASINSSVVNTSGSLSVTQLQHLFFHVDGLIAASTGPLHMAAISGTRTLGLFVKAQNIGPERWSPIGKRVQVLSPQTACLKMCTHDDCPCIRSILVENVKNIVLNWLKEKMNP